MIFVSMGYTPLSMMGYIPSSRCHWHMCQYLVKLWICMLQKKRFQIVLDYRKIGIEIYFIGIGPMKKIDPRRKYKKI